MQKILLIGDLDDALTDIYKMLEREYRVQLCGPDYEAAEFMVQVTRPVLVVTTVAKVDMLAVQLSSLVQTAEPAVPILFTETVGMPYLPDACREALENPPKPEPSETLKGSSGRKKILVVDDNGVFLRSIKVMLEPQYDVVLAKSGEKALSTAAMEKPDLILLDYEMPDWDGKQTLEKLREKEKTAKIPVVFLTGVSDKKHIVSVLKMQPQGYLLKPVNGEELTRKIMELIGP